MILLWLTLFSTEYGFDVFIELTVKIKTAGW